MNLISLFHRFVGPPPPEQQPPRPATGYPIEQRYWSAEIDAWPRAHRHQQRIDPPYVLEWEQTPLRLVAGGAFCTRQVTNGDWLWTAWATVEIDAALSVVHRFLAENHYWAPNYPGHMLPLLHDAGNPQANVRMRDLLALAVPADAAKNESLADFFDRPVFDQRLAVFACLDCGEEPLPDGEALRSLLDVDQPSGMEAPAEWTRAWLDRHTYRRWQEQGVLYGFTHHSGIVLHREKSWMGALCLPPEDLDGPRNRGCYFDLALLAFTEAALSVLAVGSPLAAEAAAHLRRVFPTPIDQGRALLALWREVYARDLGSGAANSSP
jgi:hypothetical protein